ncbi:MAG: T9SS type B sorting domain-containing protein [Bacteroidetes bacterium]|nr:T9SS type B sorting domain-containing protein [Bacteroidota bacterium]
MFFGRKSHLFSFLIIWVWSLFLSTVIAQNQHNIWYFGQKAGLKFYNGSYSVSVLTDGQMQQIEGVASISDKNGNLLFYSNGQIVYNSNHQPMNNGSGLKGHASATQGSVVVPAPGSDSLYYLFTTGAVEDGNISVYYSIIDMSLDYGYGDVISSSKNTLLYTGSCEKCAATYHCDNTSVWVMFHDYGSNQYRAYLLSKSGLSSSPVTSSIGTTHNSSWQRAGQMKFSGDGNRIANAIRGTDKSTSCVDVLEFNRSTGKVTGFIASLKPGELTHGVAFSPNDSLLYVSSGSSVPPTGTGKLNQYDLYAGNGSASAIAGSSVLLSNQSNIWFGQLQLAINGRIYLSPRNQSSLGVVYYPNAKGTNCYFVLNGQSLGGRTAELGLPNFVSTEAPPNIASLGDDRDVCENDSVVFEIKSANSTFLWQDNSTDSIFIAKKSGKYWVEVNRNGCTSSDTVNVLLHPAIAKPDIDPDTTVCENDTIWLDATTSGATYEWNDKSNQAKLAITNAGTYWVEIQKDFCKAADTVDITFKKYPPKPDLGEDTALCKVDSLVLDAASNFATYLWQDGDTGAVYTVTDSGTYHVIVDVYGCHRADTIHVSLKPDPPKPNLGNDTSICAIDTLILDATTSGVMYDWQDHSTNSTFIVRDSGTYSVVLDLDGCLSSDTIVIGRNPATPKPDLGPDTAICEGGNYLIDATTSNAIYSWQDNSMQSTFLASDSGLFWVIISVNGCRNSDSVHITQYPIPPKPNLGNDTILCDDVSLTLDATTANATYQWQDNSAQPTFETDQDGDFWVTISVNGCVNSDTVSIQHIESPPKPDLGPDGFVCGSDSVILKVEPKGASVLWQDNSTDSVFVINDAGYYWVKLSNGKCTSADSVSYLHYFPPTKPDLGNDTAICQFEELEFRVNTKEASFLWSDGSEDFIKIINQPGTYWLKFSNQCGTESDTVVVDVISCIEDILMPSGFSPNNDVVNPDFGPVTDRFGPDDYVLRIYNRWGELIFESTTQTPRWNGTYQEKVVPTGAYLWILEVKRPYQKYSSKGMVNVVR